MLCVVLKCWRESGSQFPAIAEPRRQMQPHLDWLRVATKIEKIFHSLCKCKVAGDLKTLGVHYYSAQYLPQ